eukprot:14935544-Alexandrium_andersonii.AAC.1
MLARRARPPATLCARSVREESVWGVWQTRRSALRFPVAHAARSATDLGRARWIPGRLNGLPREFRSRPERRTP